MGQGHSMVAFVVIAILYAVVGLLAAAGTIFIARRILTPKGEQIFYAVFLIMIAAFYLAFAAYFGVATTAWQAETAAVVAFVAIALLGARLPVALIVGYSLHGLWDLLHELQAHGTYSIFGSGQLTAIPLAYGVFCTAFDFSMAAYFFTRRGEWNAAWKAESRS
jgi:hypothetical protein